MKVSQKRQIYKPVAGSPMNVIVFASGGGGNLQASIDISEKYPGLLKIGLVVTDRLRIKAITIAEKYKIPVIAKDFEKECGVWNESKKDKKRILNYRKCAVKFHDDVLEEILELEKKLGLKFNLVVLSYHRWIHGKLLYHFKQKIINQHAGDLTVMTPGSTTTRTYRGINPVLMALKNGEKKTRTSTFLVNNGQDTGEILCQGPWVKYQRPYPVTKESSIEHENIQKRESDWPSLKFALLGIAKGYFSVSKKNHYPDGNKKVFFKNVPLSYQGVDLETYNA
ncbi:MAG: Methionyl-tRNA formyltransferase, phosphoribosylglycinamide formyltransferase 1 [Candidatus Gottesmanbacteria bacterium GW2011_GWA2_43_14]|uniref:phosphoribosylglycinamide formyltransferase 1 n=1 Tax=Candidatus Gottesmanbacteria bacterium GW2011_GWA2_43_14 TaxID=1618443 RepID=A0A0G1DKF9_9BACT|nr:MAG: Methionyl-tRNA formyltransferase, phosphoribosylglycinamide formyltransferase 1 [Candidatus Gottesmanbacteria bacterium GW2011_GWA2_43_14]